MGGVDNNSFDQSVFENVFLGQPDLNHQNDQIQNVGTPEEKSSFINSERKEEEKESQNCKSSSKKQNSGSSFENFIQGIVPLRYRLIETDNSNIETGNWTTSTTEVPIKSDPQISTSIFKVSNSKFGEISDTITVETRFAKLFCQFHFIFKSGQ